MLDDLINMGKNYIEYTSMEFDIEKIKNIKIEVSSPFDKTVINYKYNPNNNTLIINKNYFNREDINKENIYSDIILNVFYNNGFDCEEYHALNKGFREILANTLSGFSISSEYFESDEYIYANIVGQILGVDILSQAFIDNKPEIITEKIKEINNIEEISYLKKANDLANHNLLRANNQSLLPTIEENLLNAYLITEPSYEDITSLGANIIGSSEVFKDKDKYIGLDNINYNKKINEYINNLNNKNIKIA